MTIKEFSQLCGCNPQTLRYYDREDLLKPVKVDEWSGYRYYKEEQAISFVKIKNLQKAGFTIDEIRELLNEDNQVIYDAFEAKIAAEEKRLQEIKDIRKSYQTEITNMTKKLEEMREIVKEAMKSYDPTEEFGIDSETYNGMIGKLDGFFEKVIGDSDGTKFEILDEDDDKEKSDFADFLNNPNYEVIYEKHGWKNVKDFYSEFSNIGEEKHALLFRITQGKADSISFANTILSMICLSNPGRKLDLECSTINSDDGDNHFWLLRHR